MLNNDSMIVAELNYSRYTITALSMFLQSLQCMSDTKVLKIDYMKLLGCVGCLALLVRGTFFFNNEIAVTNTKYYTVKLFL